MNGKDANPPAGSKIMFCSCDHPEQDKLHGKGNRVHNRCKLNSGSKGWRCSVCAKVKE